jgi:hypothetical protein
MHDTCRASPSGAPAQPINQEDPMRNLTWKSATIALATLASLGFGTAQAFAAPAAPAESERACNRWACPECGSFGGTWVPSAGVCYCCG